MKVTQSNIDDLTLVVTIDVDKDDYIDKKKKTLTDYRKNADIRGFRKGMAPMSLIEKMHGENAMLDAVNNVVSDALNNHITSNKLNIIGEPLASETEQKSVNLDNDEQFSFSFDIALAPKIEISLGKDDTIQYYEMEITDEKIRNYKTNILKQYGSLQDTDIVENEDDLIVVNLTQGDTSIEGAYISLKSISDSKIRNSMIGKKKGGKMKIDVNKAFDNEADRAALLKVKKGELLSADPKYNMEVKEIKSFVPAVENQEFYDQMFGKDVVHDDKGFNEKLAERMKTEYAQESEYKFTLDAKEYVMEKAAIALPENFLKRWLYTANEGKFSMEEIEKDFAIFLKDFRWQLIRQYITKEQGLSVSKESIMDQARKLASYQFAMYGLQNIPQEQIDRYAESMLANENESRRLYEKVEDDLVIDYIRSVVSVKKEIRKE